MSQKSDKGEEIIEFIKNSKLGNKLHKNRRNEPKD